MLNIYPDEVDSEYGAQILVLTEDNVEYLHDKVFYEYDKLKEFALNIKAKGIIKLKFWRCLGTYDWGEDSHSHLYVFEEKYDDEEP